MCYDIAMCMCSLVLRKTIRQKESIKALRQMVTESGFLPRQNLLAPAWIRTGDPTNMDEDEHSATLLPIHLYIIYSRPTIFSDHNLLRKI